MAAELLNQATGIPVSILPGVSNEEVLRLHGQARLMMGPNISDAITTSTLGAIVMGSSPIQSHTCCADEWIECGRTGFLVHPEDPEAIASAIHRALADDDLVDRASEENGRLAAERLDGDRIRVQVIEHYERIAGRAGRPCASHPRSEQP